MPIVTIRDPSNNKIKIFSNVTFVKGKYENQMLLSSSPISGTWTISVTAEGEVGRNLSKKSWLWSKKLFWQTFSKTFEVQKYVLPSFFATVSAPANVWGSDQKFSVTVGAQYTFGQNVKGTAVVSFKLDGSSNGLFKITNYLFYINRLQPYISTVAPFKFHRCYLWRRFTTRFVTGKTILWSLCDDSSAIYRCIN